MADNGVFDIFVIGGGVNGCGIARDAVGRGYSVYLAEMNDLASGTSSASTKLIHGGLRYLEQYEFLLVRKALKEREVLWRMAPHLIQPMRFVLPYHRGLRPAWLLRLGLFLYDHIGGRELLPPTRVLDLREDPAGEPLKPEFRKGFEYSDCWVNDARLVVLNARDAADRGAVIRTRARVTAARDDDGVWTVSVEHADGRTEEVRAKLLVNAAGPWVDRVLTGALGRNDVHDVRLVEGAHIVVKKKFEGSRAYFFQNTDGRIFFAIPYEDDFTLIGTTDRDYTGDPADTKIAADEIGYLCEAASGYFREPVTPDEVVWTYSGVRPLLDDGSGKAQEATRDYVIKSDQGEHGAPLVNIFGGKITTYRRLAEEVMTKIGSAIGRKGKPWTAGAYLPGGDFKPKDFDRRVNALRVDYPFLDPEFARRLIRLYGTRARRFLGKARSAGDLGRYFGHDLFEAELRYLAEQEWARTGEDVLWRRTKRGLRLTPEKAEAVDRFMRALATEGADAG